LLFPIIIRIHMAVTVHAHWLRQGQNALSQKVPTFKLSVTLSKCWPIFRKFSLLKSARNLLQNPYDTTHLALGMLLRYLGKLKMLIFCTYSAHYGRKCKQLAFLSPLLLLFIHKFR